MSALASLYGGRRSWAPSGVVSPTQLRVYQVALRLNGFGLPVVSDLDGIMGPKTIAAIRAFQAASNLPVTGTLDNATAQALDNEVQSLTASGRPVAQFATQAALENARAPAPTRTMLAPTARPAARPAAVGTHPKVATLATTTGPVAVPENVSRMIPPASVETLSKMPAAQVQAFVSDLSTKVATGQATGNEVTSEGTGKDVAVTAVPMVGPNGTVTAALATAPAGWWESLSDTQKAGIAAGGTLLGVGALAALWSIAKGK